MKYNRPPSSIGRDNAALERDLIGDPDLKITVVVTAPASAAPALRVHAMCVLGRLRRCCGMQGGGSPFDAIVDFTYTVLTATARTVAFSSEQFVKRASKHTLKWLQEFQRDTVTIDEIRKKFIEASSWRTYRDQAHELAQRNLAEDKPFSEQMEAQQTRTAFSPLRTQRSAATLPRLTSPARFNRPPRPPQPETLPVQTFNTGSRPGTAEQELNVRLEQMPLSGDAGQGLSRLLGRSGDKKQNRAASSAVLNRFG